MLQLQARLRFGSWEGEQKSTEEKAMIFVETNRLFLRKVEEGDWPYFRVHLTDREKDRMMLRSPCITERMQGLGSIGSLTKKKEHT